MAKGGARPGAGNPGIGKMKQLKDNMDKYEPLFWQLMERFGHSRSKEDQRFFVQEFNKLQAKLIPQQLSGEGGGPVQVQWLSQSLTSPVSGQNPSTPAE